jgi:hypothetical protein
MDFMCTAAMRQSRKAETQPLQKYECYETRLEVYIVVLIGRFHILE